MFSINSKITRRVILGASLLSLVGCFGSGNTNDGNDPSVISAGDQFVPSDENVGKIELIVNEDEFPVGETTGFTVQVTNVNGSPVANMRIACDTEKGLALVEPTTGAEITDSLGRISGKLGCEKPGSLQFACRLPVGGNKRKFVRIKCDGPIPAGFSGFEGAGGGGLGTGGVADDGQPDGNTNNSIRISAVNFDEAGQDLTRDIDTTRDSDCDNDATTVDPEPFTDTHIKVSVLNDSASTYIMRSFRFSVPNAASGGGTYVSPSIALTGGTFDVAPNGGKTDFESIFAYQIGSNGKAFNGSSTDLGTTPGNAVRDVTITISGEDSEGNSVNVTGKVTLHFANFDRCS